MALNLTLNAFHTHNNVTRFHWLVSESATTRCSLSYILKQCMPNHDKSFYSSLCTAEHYSDEPYEPKPKASLFTCQSWHLRSSLRVQLEGLTDANKWKLRESPPFPAVSELNANALQDALTVVRKKTVWNVQSCCQSCGQQAGTAKVRPSQGQNSAWDFMYKMCESWKGYNMWVYVKNTKALYLFRWIHGKNKYMLHQHNYLTFNNTNNSF